MNPPEEPQEATPAPPAPPVIIVKKVGHHGGHHGGAWKVAYADFVTAMMALFIVLWLLSSSAQVQKSVGGYFRDPAGFGSKMGTAVSGTGEALAVAKDDMGGLQEKIMKAMKELPEFQKVQEQVQITVTGEGLRVELLETEAGLFFEKGRPQPSQQGKDLLAMLAQELGKLPNNVVIEGHTDARPFAGDGRYTNWELSTDRANAARHLMQSAGLQAAQVKQVRGFADQRLRKADEPDHASNRRVSIIVQYQAAAAQPETPVAASPAPKSAH